MGIIGKVYANSMLVLINSRMVIGSQDDPSETVISAARFATMPLSVGNGQVGSNVEANHQTDMGLSVIQLQERSSDGVSSATET